MRAWLAHREGVTLVGPVPAGCELIVWDGRDDPPPDRGDVALFVPPTWSKPASLAVLPTLTGLRVVQLLTAGADWIIPHIRPGTVLCDARGAHDPAVAEWVMTAILSTMRGFPGLLRQQSRRVWQPGDSQTLDNKKVLIVGYGSIGAALEQRILPFGTKVLRVARTARDGVYGTAALPELLPDADIVVLLLPLTSETRHLVDAGFLSGMRDGALLVNAARGAVVEPDALLAELRSGRLRAALDVTDPEPLPADHPLWALPNVLITPHVAAFTPTWLPLVYALVRDQLHRLARLDPPLNVVKDGY